MLPPLHTQSVHIHHKFSDPVLVDVTLGMGGSETQRLLAIAIRKAARPQGARGCWSRG